MYLALYVSTFPHSQCSVTLTSLSLRRPHALIAQPRTAAQARVCKHSWRFPQRVGGRDAGVGACKPALDRPLFAPTISTDCLSLYRYALFSKV
eukprot:5641525-Pleurochrysis_carterae.AAC.1